MVNTVIERISKWLHICASDFSCLSTVYIIVILVLIVLHFFLLVVFVDMVEMVIEHESKNKDLDLGSVRHIERDKSDTVLGEEARMALKT